ncbi:MAG: hypothetical protein U1A24_17375 [Cypionkella sp.]|uniref:hypothetical protein n=1 Tax=Cypionkella sp. TaxID=2811411 RepID=UPI002ABCC375|nr:hypothetical protein [Cypionkella sp.]MDZ4312322.1 hypothetical protein [Cypionkella sp.]
MEHQITPFEGVGPIKFGMTPEQVWRTLGKVPTTFRRSPQAAFPCDYFQSEGTFCYYDSDGTLEAVEFGHPARPLLGTVNLLGAAMNNAVAALSELDPTLAVEVDGAIAHQLGVSIFAPLLKDNEAATVESLLAFRRGYFD